MGYGYRDTDYFFLKIKSGFPRKAAMNHKRCWLPCSAFNYLTQNYLW
ncbi:hypothetical protein OH492_02145 [Vibrio chagasii]|nr:hypothetical protein [Vibrio chagasii]